MFYTIQGYEISIEINIKSDKMDMRENINNIALDNVNVICIISDNMNNIIL
jgi:hypothetical protein